MNKALLQMGSFLRKSAPIIATLSVVAVVATILFPDNSRATVQTNNTSASIIDVAIDCSVEPIRNQFGEISGWRFSVTGRAVPPTPAPPLPINVKVHMPWAPFATEGLSPVSTSYDYQGAVPPQNWVASAETFQQPGYAGSLTQCMFNVPDPGQPHLTVLKTGPATVTAGGEVSYSIRGTNTGNAVATDVIVTDIYPATQLEYLRASGANCSPAGGNVICQLGTLEAGASKTITVTFRVKNIVACNTPITNKVDIGWAGQSTDWSMTTSTTQGCPPPTLECTPGNQTANINQNVTVTATGGNGNYTWFTAGGQPELKTGTQTTFTTKYATVGAKSIKVTSGDQFDFCFVNIVDPTTTLTIAKSGPTTILRGQELTYQVVATNTGSIAAQNVVVSDDVLAPLTYLRATGATCVLQASARTPRGEVRCDLGTITAGQSKTVSLTFKVDDAAVCQSVIANKAVITLSNGSSATSNTVLTTVNCPVPELVCTPTTQSATVGQTIATSATGGTGTYAWTTQGGNPTTGTGSTFTTSYATSGTKTITVVSGDKQAVCTVVITQLPPPPPPGNPQLKIEKVVRNISQNGSYVDSVTALRNDTVEFRIKIWNDGQAPAQNVMLTDLLSNTGMLTGFTNLSVSRGFTGDLYGSGLSLGTLNVNDTITITYRYTVASNAVVGGICNTAKTWATNVSQIQDNSCVNVTVVSGGNVSLSFSKRAWNDTKNKDATTVNAAREDFITYTVAVSNSGNSDATGFVITDDLSGVLPLADMIDAGGGTVSGNTITYPAVTVPAGNTVIKQFRVRVKHSLASNISYVMKNTYGNTVNITINTPVTYTAPKTGSNTGTFAAIGFAGLLTAGFALHRKQNLLTRLFS